MQVVIKAVTLAVVSIIVSNEAITDSLIKDCSTEFLEVVILSASMLTVLPD